MLASDGPVLRRDERSAVVRRYALPGPDVDAQRARRVSVMGFDDVGTFEVALAVQVFATVNDHGSTELSEAAVADEAQSYVAAGTYYRVSSSHIDLQGSSNDRQ